MRRTAEGLAEVSVFQFRYSGLVEYAVRGSYEDDQVKARIPGIGRIKMRWKASGKPEVTEAMVKRVEGRTIQTFREV